MPIKKIMEIISNIFYNFWSEKKIIDSRIWCNFSYVLKIIRLLVFYEKIRYLFLIKYNTNIFLCIFLKKSLK